MSRRVNLQTVNRILTLLLACLLMLTGCSAVIDSPAITEAPQTEAETEMPTSAPTEAQVQPTEAVPETEARVIMPRAFAYQVDITHDESPELLVVDEVMNDGVAGLVVSLTKGEDEIWSANLELVGDADRQAYFLCTVGSDDYLMSYRTYFEENSYRYIVEVFYVTNEGKITPVDNELLYIRTDSYDHYPLDSTGITKFSNWFNWYLNRSTLLCCNENGTYTYSMTDVQRQYVEAFPELFSLIEDYSDCETITDKVEKINTYLYQQWFGEVDPEGTGLTVPEGFYDAADRILEASQSYLWMGAALSATRDIWFADYRGRDLQIIRTDEPYTSPLMSDDIIFYRAAEGESLQAVAKHMVERLVAEMTVPSEDRTFVITDYRILDQTMYDVTSGLEECWQSYRWLTRTEEWTVEDYLWRWLGDAHEQYGFIPVTEDMWFFTPNGIFSFDGECGEGMTMETLASDPRNVVGGKVSFVVNETPRAVRFVLIKDGTVYRMQRAEAMEELYQELITQQATPQ
ncbi:MAG: hypothetical protein IJZ85_07025 [Lachnospiraceae bacterium]|nr:hypothetical protein [Lachnospiraceae bacterium]